MTGLRGKTWLLCWLFFFPTAVRADADDTTVQALREDYQEGGALLYSALAKESHVNFVFSPYAVQTAVGMLYTGSAGATAEQLAAAMHWRLPPALLPAAHHLLDARLHAAIAADPVTWLSAAHLWTKSDASVLAPYQEALTTHFGAGVDSIVFGPKSAEVLNRWVSENTHGLLHDLLTPDAFIPAPTLVELAVTYLKAPWAVPCSAVGQKTFFSRDGSAKVVPMVRRPQGRGVAFAQTTTFTAVELPYAQNTLSMLMIMPKGNIDIFEKNLNATTFASVLAALHPDQVEVTFPKFEISTPFHIKKALHARGVRDVFDEHANLSAISKLPLHVDQILEQARIQVDEHGTEAAAAVATTMRPLAMPMPAQQFVVDHPFLFVIQNHDMAVPLFMGRVTSL